MQEIYLDNSATTPMHREVLELINRVQEEVYGNPSSLHEKGLAAGRLIAEARRRVAFFFRGREKEIIFTSGGTEANNLAIIGYARRNRKKGRRLITSEAEHPSVLNCFRYLEKEGFQVSYLPVDKSGLVDPGRVRSETGPDTILASIMHVNNEIGTIQPLTAIGQAVKAGNPSAIFHVDAVQSFTRLTLEPDDWQADLISCSSHKIHGPKGAGCLWARTGTRLEPLLHGGGQEKGLRSGTENCAAIAGFGLAARISGSGQAEKTAALQSLKEALLTEIDNGGIAYHVNGPPVSSAAPQIINIAFPGLKAEVLMHALEEKGIYVSAGSACHSRHPEPSHVLTAIGLDRKKLDGSLRFSFSCANTRDDVLSVAGETVTLVKQLAPSGQKT